MWLQLLLCRCVVGYVFVFAEYCIALRNSRLRSGGKFLYSELVVEVRRGILSSGVREIEPFGIDDRGLAGNVIRN